MRQYHKCTDSELIGLLKTGDQLAFTEIYKRYWPLLYSHSRRMLRDDQDAMDVVQDVFTLFWKKGPELVLTISLKAYLYAAIRNATLNAIDKSKTKSSYLQSISSFIEKGEPITDNQIAFNELSAQIDKEIENLPPKMRTIFDMSRNLGFSYKQIAEKLDISDETVKKTISRALKILRTQFSLLFSFIIF